MGVKRLYEVDFTTLTSVLNENRFSLSDKECAFLILIHRTVSSYYRPL